MAREGLMDDTGYHGFDNECEDGDCKECKYTNCVWHEESEEKE